MKSKTWRNHERPFKLYFNSKRQLVKATGVGLLRINLIENPSQEVIDYMKRLDKALPKGSTQKQSINKTVFLVKDKEKAYPPQSMKLEWKATGQKNYPLETTLTHYKKRSDKDTVYKDLERMVVLYDSQNRVKKIWLSAEGLKAKDEGLTYTFKWKKDGTGEITAQQTTRSGRKHIRVQSISKNTIAFPAIFDYVRNLPRDKKQVHSFDLFVPNSFRGRKLRIFKGNTVVYKGTSTLFARPNPSKTFHHYVIKMGEQKMMELLFNHKNKLARIYMGNNNENAFIQRRISKKMAKLIQDIESKK